MCLIVFAYNSVPDYVLILAANRDEFYDRPTLPAHFWEENENLLAGKDLKAGGTWMGINRNGRYAALTNYRNMGVYDTEARSRGLLVKNYLSGTAPAKEYLENLEKPDEYNGFNLLAGNPGTCCHFSNITGKTTVLKPGVHGVSNALMNTPWPKVELSKVRFQKLVEEDELTDEHLFHLLLNTEKQPDDLLPDTGLPPELEKAVSAPFIQTKDYGTRCSTLLFIKTNGDVRFVERTYKPGTMQAEEEKTFTFRIAAGAE